MKALYISLLIFLLPINMFAQWEWLYPYPTNDDLRKIQFVSETTGWILGDNSLLKTSDSGITWSQQDTNNCREFVDLYFVDEINGWFICRVYGYNEYYDKIYHSVDGGNSWQHQNTFNGRQYRSVFFIDSLNGWLTNGNNILYTTDSGISWLIPSMDTTVQGIRDVFFFNDNKGWAVSAYGDILNSTDGGLIWNLQISGIDKNLSSVEFIDEYNGFVIGSSPLGLPSWSTSVFLKTSNGGNTWESLRVDSNYSCTLFSLAILDAENFMIVGSTMNLYGSVDGFLYKSTNSGLDWTRTAIEDYQKGLYAVNDQTVFLVGSTGQIRKTTDVGVSWQMISKHLILGYPFKSVFFLNDNDGWITSGNGSILHTNNGGNMWYSQSSGTNNRLQDIMFANSFLGWIVGYQTILKTTNKGEEWMLVDPGFYVGSCTDVFCIDEYCWIIDGGIIRSTNSGSNWNRIYLDYPLNSAWFISNTTGWVVGSYGAIYKTENGGDTWTPQNSGTTYALSGVFFINEKIGWIRGSWGGGYQILLKTTNGGEVWEAIWNNSDYVYIYSLIFIDTLNGWMVGSNDNILKSTDGGNTWNQEVNYCLPNSYTSLCFTPSNTGWIVGGDGLVLSTKMPITNIEQLPKTETNDYSLSQNYPNPFNPVTKIKFEIPGQARNDNTLVTLKIYDLLGREIATLINEEKAAGEYDVEFNAANLPSGIYFYRIQAGSYIKTKKMVLLR